MHRGRSGASASSPWISGKNLRSNAWKIVNVTTPPSRLRPHSPATPAAFERSRLLSLQSRRSATSAAPLRRFPRPPGDDDGAPGDLIGAEAFIGLAGALGRRPNCSRSGSMSGASGTRFLGNSPVWGSFCWTGTRRRKSLSSLPLRALPPIGISTSSVGSFIRRVWTAISECRRRLRPGEDSPGQSVHAAR